MTNVALTAARIKKNRATHQTKFKVRCKRYLYTLVLKDSDKAEKLKQSLPPGTYLEIRRDDGIVLIMAIRTYNYRDTKEERQGQAGCAVVLSMITKSRMDSKDGSNGVTA